MDYAAPTAYPHRMALIDTLLTALSSPKGFKDALGATFNQCEVGSCVRTRRKMSLGASCELCGVFCCGFHGFVPLSAVPHILQTQRPVVVCLGCLVVKAKEEASP